ncbi:MAG: hypothetical protein EOO67_00195 [Microbacterium sp.]|nr:MAG: hypothetical protein EOO67_00195 [Microbacterium sp.]
MPVTLTLILVPRCAAFSVYTFLVAPAMRAPFAYHWYVRAVPDVHVPGRAVSFFPTFAVPEIFGVGAVSVRA